MAEWTASMASYARRQLANSAEEPLGAHSTALDGQTGTLQVVTWILLVITVLTILVQLTTCRGSFYMTKKFNLISVTTLLLCIGQAVAVSLQNHYGFGKHITSLTSAQIEQVLKARYAGELLYILGIYSAKLFFISFLFDLSPLPLHKTTLWATTGLTAAWTLSSFLVAAFQCRVPETWNNFSNRCIDTDAFWLYYDIFNILTDAFLVVFSIFIVFGLNMPSMTRKLKISTYFALRVAAIAATIAQIVLRRQDSQNRDDITFRGWPVQIATQVVLTMSVLVSAVPLLRPFMASLETGMIRVDDLRRKQRQEGYTNTANFTGRSRQRSQHSGPSSQVSDRHVVRKLSIPAFQPLKEKLDKADSSEGAS